MVGRYLIQNATVISVDAAIGIVPNCDVLIEHGIITAVAQNLPTSTDLTIIDATDAIVSPGFVDTHRHTWQTQLRTITSDYVLSDYVVNIRNIYGSCYTPHDAYVGNYCGALESIDNGITYLVDHSHIMNFPIMRMQPSRVFKTPKSGRSFAMACMKTPLGKARV